MSKTTTRWGLPYPELSDAPDAPRDFKALATSLNGVAMDDQGTLAARPASSVGSPGKLGRYYYATDTGTLYRDTGTSWMIVRSGLEEQAGVKIPSADTTLTTSMANITGLLVEVEPKVKSRLLVTLSAAFGRSSGATHECIATLKVDSTEITGSSVAVWVGAEYPNNQAAISYEQILEPGAHTL